MWTLEGTQLEVRVSCDEVDLSRRRAYGIRVLLGDIDVTNQVPANDLADMEQDLVADALLRQQEPA